MGLAAFALRHLPRQSRLARNSRDGAELIAMNESSAVKTAQLGGPARCSKTAGWDGNRSRTAGVIEINETSGQTVAAEDDCALGDTPRPEPAAEYVAQVMTMPAAKIATPTRVPTFCLVGGPIALPRRMLGTLICFVSSTRKETHAQGFQGLLDAGQRC